MDKQTRDIDVRLEGQLHVRKMIQAMPEDAPSMAWRAELNQRILDRAAKRRRWELVWKPTLGLGLAAALTLAIFIRPTRGPVEAPVNEARLAEAMIAAHQEFDLRQEMWTVPNDSAAPNPTPVDWTEADLDSL